MDKRCGWTNAEEYSEICESYRLYSCRSYFAASSGSGWPNELIEEKAFRKWYGFAAGQGQRMFTDPAGIERNLDDWKDGEVSVYIKRVYSPTDGVTLESVETEIAFPGGRTLRWSAEGPEASKDAIQEKVAKAFEEEGCEIGAEDV